MSKTPDKQLGYSQGYAAGTRRAVREVSREQIQFAREDFVQRMMIAIAPQVIANPWGWKKGDKFVKDDSANEIMRTVRMIAEEAAKTCAFFAPVTLQDTPS